MMVSGAEPCPTAQCQRESRLALYAGYYQLHALAMSGVPPLLGTGPHLVLLTLIELS